MRVQRNIILCGYHWAGCEALRILKQYKGNNIFVYTHDAPYPVPDLKQVCERFGVPYSTDDVSTTELPFKPDIVCSIYYRNIIKESVIQSCEGKIFNLHPSLLPKYRGCSSITWAMIEGEKEVGYTYHYITKDVDCGNILLQNAVPIHEFDTQLSLYYRVMFEALKDFHEVLDMVLNGRKGILQTGEGSYHKRGCPLGGCISELWCDDKVERFIRAMTFPPLPPATYKGKPVYTFKDYQEMKGSG